MSRARALFARWRWLWIALAIGLGTLGLKLALNTISHSHGRPIPELAKAPWVVLATVPIVMVVSVVVALIQHKGILARLGLLVLHLVLTAAIGIGALISEPGFPGNRHVEATLALPDDHGTAYLYQDGILCHRSVWVAPPGALFSRLPPDSPRGGCEDPVTMSWNEQRERIEVTIPDGSPLSHGTDWGRGFDWRPH